jgi:hypothetical protein
MSEEHESEGGTTGADFDFVWVTLAPSVNAFGGGHFGCVGIVGGSQVVSRVLMFQK